MKAPILITGCARSGTSMVAGVINICGAFGGEMSGPNKNNEKGMFENKAIRERIVKDFYRQLEVDHLGQYPLPDPNNMVIPTSWKKRIERIMEDEGYVDGPWFYKGAKMCQHWPVWDYAFPSAKWVIVRRKTPDIIESCVKTGFMRAFKNSQMQKDVGAKNEREGWYWWVKEHEKRFVEMITAGLNTQVIWPERMVEGDYRFIKNLIEWLGLEWKGKEVAEFIEPKLWKARHKK